LWGFSQRPGYNSHGQWICHDSAIIGFLRICKMSGLDPDTPRPTNIALHQASHKLELTFDDGTHGMLSCEFLRVYSPSAEVRGHGRGQEVLQTGKEDVNIDDIEPVGNYAIRLIFSDGHDTGLYSWDYLYELVRDQSSLWQAYLDKLAAAGITRKPSAGNERPMQ
jgi:DUF971 family protein